MCGSGICFKFKTLIIAGLGFIGVSDFYGWTATGLPWFQQLVFLVGLGLVAHTWMNCPMCGCGSKGYYECGPKNKGMKKKKR